MPKRRPLRVTRDQPGGINPGSFGRKAPPGAHSMQRWTSQMGSSSAGAKEVLVKISGGGRDADGVQAHLEYIDRHGKLELETDYGEKIQGRTAATTLVNDWALNYGHVPGAPHSRSPAGADGRRRAVRQAFNIVLSMPAGTPPAKVLQAAKKFAREEFAHQHRYAMALHVEHKDNRPVHPHVHLVVKAEHEYGGPRLSPWKDDLQRWRERFAEYMTELGVLSTATRRQDRGLTKTGKKTPIYRATQRAQKSREGGAEGATLYTGAGDSIFMRKKLEAVKRELRAGKGVDPNQYRSLLNVRAQVNERYREAIHWLRSSGREEEARRFELMQKNLAPVKTENQLIAEALTARDEGRAVTDRGQGRGL
ncbi:MAG: relaxase/mobilization nuclease domain-containing protein [Steroidobacteraceae bacterium]